MKSIVPGIIKPNRLKPSKYVFRSKGLPTSETRLRKPINRNILGLPNKRVNINKKAIFDSAYNYLLRSKQRRLGSNKNLKLLVDIPVTNKS